MLVCAFFTHFGTRDRGCSAHPAFPAPSIFEGGNVDAQLGQIMPRDRGRTFSPRRPCESRDPYAAAEVVRARWSTALLQQQPPVAMGPCFRRDDRKSRGEAEGDATSATRTGARLATDIA